jgi:poly(hydroxyalkanoate) depolymerase family esterase
MRTMTETMRRAMRLMRSGDLKSATHAIRQGLAGATSATHADPTPEPDAGSPHAGKASTPSDCIDGEFRVVPADEIQPSSAPDARPADGVFRALHFSCEAGDIDYKLYVPVGLDTARAPLLLMLHGCTQSPDDFARGTRMNALAGDRGWVVAYPEQSIGRNANRCWNWFRRADQHRGKGEPALLASLTRALVSTHDLDPRRIYVAGLSAGGAMAAVLADAYPEIYAAIGVHSGLPVGLASDVPSAFQAMRSGGKAARSRKGSPASVPVPAIVFHGDRDTTVHPDNAPGVVAQSLGTAADDATTSSSTIEQGRTDGGRTWSRTVYRLADGSVGAEYWSIHGAGHAWSGGDPAGSYTDSTGPDASAEMLRFLSSCIRHA